MSSSRRRKQIKKKISFFLQSAPPSSPTFSIQSNRRESSSPAYKYPKPASAGSKEEIFQFPMPPPPSQTGKEWEEGTGESSSPPRSSSGHHDLRHSIFERLAGKQGESDPSSFWVKLCAHFDRLPERYLTDLSVGKAEDVLLHRRVLDEVQNGNLPVFEARFIEYLQVQPKSESTYPDCDDPTQRLLLEDLTLERIHVADTTVSMSSPSRDSGPILVHEIIFSSFDKPKLLMRLTSLLSEVGLNIREAHVYSTTDGFCLDVFVVDGWDTEETGALIATIKENLKQKNGATSNSASTSSSGKILELRQQVGDCEVDWSMLTMTEKIGSASYADLYRGTYAGYDVCIKVLRITHFDSPSEVEFLQQALILRRVNHENILKFYGTCTGRPKWFGIVTEYMAGGNLYDFLHTQNDVLGLLVILKTAIQISKGMEYLHQNSIIHRDLKTANILIGQNQVVKIADFGVARLGSQEGHMTAETGTYRWMAPEIINHMPYDHKADVFSFAIVLWELVTLKIPYDNMTPLQAVLGVRQGLRLEIPPGTHPGLSELIEQCWDDDPDERPVFAEITVQLEEILQEVQPPKVAHRRSKGKMQKKYSDRAKEKNRGLS
ncbi:serine/threonine-protein kinase STY8 [Lolium perenne]|uniref:serine/threonine-protein kinase STY8 n=1 Tax=Lolium perenne TaxID=4522 RepID=UPI0021F63B5E|nr:serine/threonine-protein kinase STY8-like [Lolium perenne]